MGDSGGPGPHSADTRTDGERLAVPGSTASPRFSLCTFSRYFASLECNLRDLTNKKFPSSDLLLPTPTFWPLLEFYVPHYYVLISYHVILNFIHLGTWYRYLTDLISFPDGSRAHDHRCERAASIHRSSPAPPHACQAHQGFGAKIHMSILQHHGPSCALSGRTSGLPPMILIMRGVHGFVCPE